MPWRGPKTALQGYKHKPHLRQGLLQDGLGPRTRRRQQKSQFMQGRQQKFHFMQGPWQGPLTRQQAPSTGAQAKIPCSGKQKIPFQAGVVCRGQGLNRQEGHSRQGHQQKIPFQAGVVCGGQGLDREHAHSC